MASESKLPNRQDLKQAAANIPAAFRLVWDAHKPATLMMAALTIVGALIPAGQAYG
ncbi:MAG: hypothetical protein U0559_02290 [Anaerolineae bacterium]